MEEVTGSAAGVPSLTWWVGYTILVVGVALIVAVVAANAAAGFIAGGGVVLSATWTAGRYRRD